MLLSAKRMSERVSQDGCPTKLRMAVPMVPKLKAHAQHTHREKKVDDS